MSTHSLAEAKDHLSELIDRALSGEAVTITRDGSPVVELKPLQDRSAIQQPPRGITSTDIEWLRAHRVGRRTASIDAGELVSRMRDEDEK